MADLVYFTVTGKFQAIISDASSDEDNQPQVQNISGLVKFTPSAREVASSSLSPTTIVRLQPIQGRIEEDGVLKTIDGNTGVKLVANTAALGPLAELSYLVEFTNVVYDKLKDQRIEPFRFMAPTSSTTIDLATVARIPV